MLDRSVRKWKADLRWRVSNSLAEVVHITLEWKVILYFAEPNLQIVLFSYKYDYSSSPEEHEVLFYQRGFDYPKPSLNLVKLIWNSRHAKIMNILSIEAEASGWFCIHKACVNKAYFIRDLKFSLKDFQRAFLSAKANSHRVIKVLYVKTNYSNLPQGFKTCWDFTAIKMTIKIVSTVATKVMVPTVAISTLKRDWSW